VTSHETVNQFDIGKPLSNLAFFLLVVLDDYKQLRSDSRVVVGDPVKDRPLAFVFGEVDHLSSFRLPKKNERISNAIVSRNPKIGSPRMIVKTIQAWPVVSGLSIMVGVHLFWWTLSLIFRNSKGEQ
jgi:hypothetical protein